MSQINSDIKDDFSYSHYNCHLHVTFLFKPKKKFFATFKKSYLLRNAFYIWKPNNSVYKVVFEKHIMQDDILNCIRNSLF